MVNSKMLLLEEISLNISEILYRETLNISRPGFLTGDMGLCLLMDQQIAFGNRNILVNRIGKVIDRTISLCNENINININYGRGLAGFGWALNFLQKNKLFSNSFEIINVLNIPIIFQLKRHVINGNFDLLSGANGIMLYLSTSDGFDFKEILDFYIAGLNKTAVYDAFGVKWSSSTRDKNGDIVSSFNFGIPHGMAGTLLLLLNLSKHNEASCYPLIVEIVNSFKKRLQLNDKSLIGVNGMFSKNEVITQNIALGWCNGNLCVGYALLKAASALGDESIKKLAIDLINSTISKTIVFKNIQHEICLCHGYISIAYMYYKIYGLTKKEIYNPLKWAKISMDILINKFNSENDVTRFNGINNNSLLYGFPGLLIPLFTILNNNSSRWDNSILL